MPPPSLVPLSEAFGCSLTAIRARTWASATFTGWLFEVEVDRDLLADVDTWDLPEFARFIVADVATLAPRTLSLLLIEDR